MHLPKHIADLVGVVFGTPAPAKDPAKPAPRSPISVLDNGDGTLTVKRFRKTVGWMSPVHLAGDRDGWKALSVHGEVKNCYSLRAARDFLLSSYH